VRRFGLYIGFLWSLSSFAVAQGADDWRTLSGPEITDTLIGVTLDYESAWQDFRESGKTLYNSGGNSWGNWRVEGDQYCSQWPPRDLWDCYDVAISGAKVRFTGAFEDVSIGTLRK